MKLSTAIVALLFSTSTLTATFASSDAGPANAPAAPAPPAGPPPMPGKALPKGDWKAKAAAKAAAEAAAQPQRAANTGRVSTLPVKDLSALPHIIEQFGVNPRNVYVAFDFDATITEKKDSGDGVQLRGGDQTRMILSSLKRQGVNFIILTAAIRSHGGWSVISDELKEFKIDKIFNIQSTDQSEFVMENGGYYKGNLVSAPNRNKFDLYDYFVNVVKGNATASEADRPQLLIFVDDSGANVEEMYDYFKNKPQYYPINVVAMHIPPAPGKGGVEGGSDATTPSQEQFVTSHVDSRLSSLADTTNYRFSRGGDSGAASASAAAGE